MGLFKDVRSALRAAGASDFVEELVGGLDASVGERGTMLSGGQRQRIAIARALVRRPTLLILDEITSALDPVTEAAILESLSRLKGKVTMLFISHQEAVETYADRTFLLAHQRLSGSPRKERPVAALRERH